MQLLSEFFLTGCYFKQIPIISAYKSSNISFYYKKYVLLTYKNTNSSIIGHDLKKVNYITICLLLLMLRGNAYHHTRDSLEAILHSQLGKERLNTLIELSDHITYTSPAEAIRLANEAILLAEKTNDLSFKFRALKVRGYANGYAGNIVESMSDMQEGLDYYLSIKDSSRIAEALSDIGYLHQSQGVYDKALRNFQISLSIREKIHDQKGIAYSLNNIGALYWRLGKADEALDYHLQAIKFFEENKMDEETGIATANLGEIYVLKEEPEKALYYFNRSLDINRKLGHQIFEANNLNSIGNIHLNNNEHIKAIRYFLRAVAIQQKAGDKNGLAFTHYHLGLAYKQQNKLNESLGHFEISIAMAEASKANDILIKSLNHSAQVHNRLGKDKMAYDELNRAKQLNDSIFNLERNKQIEELKAIYETEKHVLENKNLKMTNSKNDIIISQHRILLMMTIILSLSIVLIIWLYLQKRRSADKIKAIEMEQKLLRSQMNPHFVFNTLTAIQNNILQKTVREGVNMISSLATLMRLTLDNSSNEFIPFEKEVQSLQLYLMLQQKRYGEQFDFQLETDPAINKEGLAVPPVLAQPFIENAIEHGFSGISYKGNIRISYTLINNGLLCEVEDNGIGYESGLQAKPHNNKHHSYGIDITRQRVDILKKKFRMDARIEIIDLKNREKSGTLVKIYMPVKPI